MESPFFNFILILERRISQEEFPVALESKGAPRYLDGREPH